MNQLRTLTLSLIQTLLRSGKKESLWKLAKLLDDLKTEAYGAWGELEIKDGV